MRRSPSSNASRGGELVERIGAIRKNPEGASWILTRPSISATNRRLRPGAYRLLVSGNEMGDG